MSFLHSEPNESDSGATKFVVLAVVVLASLGGVAFWFLRSAPEPTTPSTEKAAPSAVVEKEEPVEAPPPRTRTKDIATTGALAIAANVEGASVYLDGKLVGEAPYETSEIATGRHDVRVEKDGYQPFRDQVQIRPDAKAELSAQLVLLPPSLRIVSDVPGATVFLDRNYIGTTPVDIKDVKAGEHQLTVSADGYDMYAETVSVTTGHRDVRVSFKNVTLQERIKVVHKHRMGSCEGTLIADNSGLRYESSNKSDAFAVPFSELEQFEVGYIEKNLNIKVRKGRNYNFTEKSGNADPLFVFHKNVQAFMETQ